MGHNYSFELARPDDDAAIRRLLRDNPVPGQLELTYEREPNYFLGCSIMGHTCQTLVARQQESGDVVGLATRAVRPLFVNGEVEPIGYIGQLRVDSAHRGRWLVPMGFRLFEKLHQDGTTTGYITTIIEGNTEAEGILVEKARHHYPAYCKLDRLVTLALVLRRPRRLSTATFEVLAGNEVGLDEIIHFLHECGQGKQFFPAYTAEDFTGDATRDFCIDEFAVACRGNQIVGVLGLWDQSRYKQTVVKAYGNKLQRVRPFYNVGARVLGAHSLTQIGQPIHFAYASFVCVAGDDPVVFNALLTQVYNWAVERRFAFLMLGLSERDPLLAVAQKWLHIPYHSTIYTVSWQGDEGWQTKLDGRVPYLELATL